MNRTWIILGGIAAVLLIIFLMYRSSYNRAISLQETVAEKWSNVGATYQRRADLVPQLVATVKGAAANERGILTQVTEARAGIVKAQTPEEMDIMGKKINTAINLAFEAYPQIRSTENFADLQTQLEGTENRIAVARQAYNEAVKDYNGHIRGFFNSMFLSKTVFQPKVGFEEAAGAEKAPKVEF
ncbi:MAG TPA: LemA family protein [Bacteroidia bacterium]|nr:LemA family protein [Bacteroidia bacterium]